MAPRHSRGLLPLTASCALALTLTLTVLQRLPLAFLSLRHRGSHSHSYSSSRSSSHSHSHRHRRDSLSRSWRGCWAQAEAEAEAEAQAQGEAQTEAEAQEAGLAVLAQVPTQVQAQAQAQGMATVVAGRRLALRPGLGAGRRLGLGLGLGSGPGAGLGLSRGSVSGLSFGLGLGTARHPVPGTMPTPGRIALAAAGAESDGPVGDWVECDISYTPSVSMMPGREEPRRTDTYVFHKRQLQEDFGHLYAKLGFTIQEGVVYRDVKTVCREPEGLKGVCKDCFKFIFGGSMGFVGMTSPKYYDRKEVPVDECIGDTMKLRQEADALPADKTRPDTSYWCMRND